MAPKKGIKGTGTEKLDMAILPEDIMAIAKGSTRGKGPISKGAYVLEGSGDDEFKQEEGAGVLGGEEIEGDIMANDVGDVNTKKGGESETENEKTADSEISEMVSLSDEQQQQMASFASMINMPFDQIMQEAPEEVLQIREGIESDDAKTLKSKLSREMIKNRRFQRWINMFFDHMKKGGGAPPSQLPRLQKDIMENLGLKRENDADAGDAMTKVAKELMPLMMQYKFTQEMLRGNMDNDDSGTGSGGGSGGGGKSSSKRMKWKTPDGVEVEMPMENVPPWVLNDILSGKGGGGGGSGGSSAGEAASAGTSKMARIKMGDREVEGPTESLGWIWQAVGKEDNGAKNAEPMAMVKDAEGVEHTVPVSALPVILDLTMKVREQEYQQQGRRRNENIKDAGSQEGRDAEELLTITDEEGKTLQMPVSYYPIYLAQQQLQGRQGARGGDYGRGSRDRGAGDGQPDIMSSREIAQVNANISRLANAVKEMAEMNNPRNLTDVIFSGMEQDMERVQRYKMMFGGKEDSDDVVLQRIRESAETERKRIEEEHKTARAQERTRQAEIDGQKISALLTGFEGGGGGGEAAAAAGMPGGYNQQQQQPQPQPPRDPEEVLRASKRALSEFVPRFEGEEQYKSGNGSMEEEEEEKEEV